MGPENEDEEEVYFFGIGPEPEDLSPRGPEFELNMRDPLLRWEEEEEDSLDNVFVKGGGPGGREWWSIGDEMSRPYIFPSSPEFLMSPPVYGTAREAITGWRSLSCFG